MNPDTLTPRTDAELNKPRDGVYSSFFSMANLARQLERELTERTNEVARLRELLNRAIEIADESWDAEGYVQREYEDRLQAIKDELARLAPAPEEPKTSAHPDKCIGNVTEPVDDWRCHHCGSTKGTWFDRVEPMGDICEDCEKAVDEEPVIQDSRITEPVPDRIKSLSEDVLKLHKPDTEPSPDKNTELNTDKNTEQPVSNSEWRELGPDEVICERDEVQALHHNPIGTWVKVWKHEVGTTPSNHKAMRFRTLRPLPTTNNKQISRKLVVEPKQEEKAPDDLHSWMRLQEEINKEVAGEIKSIREITELALDGYQYLRDEIKNLKSK